MPAISFRTRFVEETGSTNADIAEAAVGGEPAGLILVAGQQTAGRGRHGRTWSSPVGNLYMSVLLRPDCPSREVGHYGFIAALALRDAIEHFTHRDRPLALKWPNDILLNGKKLAGILIDAAPPEAGSTAWLAVGMGVNLRFKPDQALAVATSLADEDIDPVPSPVAMASAIVDALALWMDVLERDGFLAVRAAWLRHGLQGNMSVRLPQETIKGAFAGLNEDGHLLLRLGDGTERTVTTGDVFV